MVHLNALREALGLPPVTPDEALPGFEAASSRLPGIPAARWRPAYARLLALELRPQLPALLELLADAERGLHGPHAERELVGWLAAVTGGEAAIRSSWGDLVARQGEGSGVRLEQRLVYEGRPVGSLELHADPAWEPLFRLVAELARLARLQSAAAGAARRRVGERHFEQLLAGDASAAQEGGPWLLAALRLDRPLPRNARAREMHIHRLDVLCAVGEGYLQGHVPEGGQGCLTTVRGDTALWLWPARDPEGEARGLHTALLNATDQPFRLGVSGPLPGQGEAPAALRQALRALDEVREARGLAFFQRLDPLQALLDSPALAALAEQLRGRLRAADEGGRLEDTLRQYLGHRGSLASLAATLNLHVNTLRYRLRRIEELLGGELSEPAFLARLYLAFHSGGQGA